MWRYFPVADGMGEKFIPELLITAEKGVCLVGTPDGVHDLLSILLAQTFLSPSMHAAHSLIERSENREM